MTSREAITLLLRAGATERKRKRTSIRRFSLSGKLFAIDMKRSGERLSNSEARQIREACREQ